MSRGHARLWLTCVQLGLGEVLRGKLRGGDKEGSCQEARQTLNSGMAEARPGTPQGTGTQWLGEEWEKEASASLKGLTI